MKNQPSKRGSFDCIARKQVSKSGRSTGPVCALAPTTTGGFRTPPPGPSPGAEPPASAGVAQAGGDPVDRQQQGPPQFGRDVALPGRPHARQQIDLQVGDRVEVGVAYVEGPLQYRRLLEQLGLPG